MHKRRIRLTGATLAGILLLVLAAAQGASAAPFTSSRITTPADGSFFIAEPPAPEGEMTISGTVEGSTEPGTVELHCDSAKEATEVAEVEQGELKEESAETWSFSVKVPVSEIGEEPCVLRAVPEAHGPIKPGSASPFEGPRVAFSEFQRRENTSDKAIYSFEVEARTVSTTFEIDAAGGCGLGPTRLLSTSGLAEGDELFRCAGGLYRVSPAATRAAIQVGGKNAYDPETADSLERTIKPAGTPPSLTVTNNFDKASGLKSIHETDPLVVCEGKTTAYPETGESCEKFAGAGISLERTWTITHGGRLIAISDTWHSTGSAPHTVSALYSQELASYPSAPGTWEFPGASSFTATTTGESIPLSSGEGAILYREAAGAEETPDAVHPLAAITFDSSPSGPAQVSAGTQDAKSSGALVMPYSLEIPAGGTRKLGMAFAEGYTPAEVCALAEEAKSGCQPTTAIIAPTAGTTSAAPSVTVTGTASDVIGPVTVKVNGSAVPVSGGAWSTTVALVPGANQITAVATSQAGLTHSTTTTVNYVPSPPPAPPGGGVQGTPTASRLGAAKLVKGSVTIALACTGPRGTSCNVKVTLSTVEKLRGGRPTALAAKTKTVTIGSASASITAGSSRTLTIKLNATGRALLARFHKLPLHLAALQQSASGAGATIASQNLTLAVKHG